MSHHINAAARRYLLTGKVPKSQTVGGSWNLRSGGTVYQSGCWGVQGRDAGTVRFFATVGLRDLWVSAAPSTRFALGKRHPRVKAFRNRARCAA